MRKLKKRGRILRLSLGMNVLCVLARRALACLKVVAAAVSAADSLILPRATAAATSLRRRLHFHRGADLDVIVK